MERTFWNIKAIFTGLIIFGLLFSACQRGPNNQPNFLPGRVVTQTEYLQGAWNSTATFRYDNDRIIYRDYRTSQNHYKFEYAYNNDTIWCDYSRRYGELWRTLSRFTYCFDDNLLKQVLFEDYTNKTWVKTEQWRFTYLDGKYDEVFFDNILNDTIYPIARIKYFYSEDLLTNYEIYDYDNGWQLNKELFFSYIEGVLQEIVIYYEGFGLEYGPQERFTYEYTNDLVSRIGISVYDGENWPETSAVYRQYDINNNMTRESLRLTESTKDYYRYNYEYMLGKDNLEVFPFYDQPLIEYIYPSVESRKTIPQIVRFTSPDALLKPQFSR
jgi:hypothetical protein